MRNLINRLHVQWSQLRNNVSGATAIEYGLFAALISVVIVAALIAVGTELNTTFGTVLDKLQDANE